MKARHRYVTVLDAGVAAKLFGIEADAEQSLLMGFPRDLTRLRPGGTMQGRATYGPTKHFPQIRSVWESDITAANVQGVITITVLDGRLTLDAFRRRRVPYTILIDGMTADGDITYVASEPAEPLWNRVGAVLARMKTALLPARDQADRPLPLPEPFVSWQALMDSLENERDFMKSIALETLAKGSPAQIPEERRPRIVTRAEAALRATVAAAGADRATTWMDRDLGHAAEILFTLDRPRAIAVITAPGFAATAEAYRGLLSVAAFQDRLDPAALAALAEDFLHLTLDRHRSSPDRDPHRWNSLASVAGLLHRMDRATVEATVLRVVSGDAARADAAFAWGGAACFLAFFWDRGDRPANSASGDAALVHGLVEAFALPPLDGFIPDALIKALAWVIPQLTDADFRTLFDHAAARESGPPHGQLDEALHRIREAAHERGLLPPRTIVVVRPAGTSLGQLRKGQTITIRYLRGTWKSRADMEAVSPDSLNLMTGHDDYRLSLKQVDVGGSARIAQVFKDMRYKKQDAIIDADGPYVLAMKNPGRGAAGEVSYQVDIH